VSLESLRQLLLSCKPAGPDGFEGLVADALASFTGLTIRLAKSGSQFGRDASSSSAPFAIAIEAKRYDNDLRLEDLSGKAVLAGYFLTGEIDLWALCATSEVGEGVVRQLGRMLDDYGISFLVLDWTPRPQPPLAVLFACSSAATLEWFSKHQPAADSEVLKQALAAVRTNPHFASQAEELRISLTASEVGLDALRRKNAEWLQARFSDRAQSQLSFGQYVAVSSPSAPAMPRSSAIRSLTNELYVSEDAPDIVALIGAEGVGKTWLVAQWIAATIDPPIVIFVSGRRAELLNAAKPRESLANLIVDEISTFKEGEVQSWIRRLKRWEQWPRGRQLRFVLVLDGINEHSTRPWSDILKAFSTQIHALSGIVIVTARESFWKRDVLARMGSDYHIRPIALSGYTDEELGTMLARVGRTPAVLPGSVRDFVRNPRVCSVALDLLQRLSFQPEELTVERLLIEYWRRRMEERSDLLGHDVQDFHKLLRSHARAWLQRPGRSFERDDWRIHSGAVRRLDAQSLRNDLTEIEEGRFLQIVADDANRYSFRPEALPFALALLVTYEVKTKLARPNQDAGECIDGILDPIRGFDLVADILVAAIGLACLDQVFPKSGRVALIRAWLGLQNIQPDVIEVVLPYVLSCPEVFLDAAEIPTLSAGRADRRPSWCGC